uniref:Variant surface glycoprotein 1125.4205 n=1 Tax=Trypanosoma brucei TaxID=5691 RepID=A0A1J0RAB2_9TRYP|nr:variant surface glycoprotein 1125.4205 [Trypanosoma brucei]
MPDKWKALVLLAIVSTLKVTADTNAGDNAVSYMATCGLLLAATKEPAIENIEDTWTAIHKKILQANMSAAPAEWRTQFLKENNKAQEWDPKGKTKGKPSEWAQQWQPWAEQAEAIAGESDAEAKAKIAALQALKGAARKVAQLELASLINRTEKIVAKLNAIKNKDQKPRKQQVKELLKTALYGQADGQSEFEKADGRATGNRARAMCRSGAKVDNQETLADVMLCLCVDGSAGSAAGTKKVCADKSDDHISQVFPLSGTGHLKTVFGQLSKGCGKPGDSRTTAAEIRAAIIKIKSQITIKDKDGYLGKYDTNGDCDGTSGSGFCVKYVNYALGTNAPYDKIGWVLNAEKAAELIEETARQIKTAEALTSVLETLEQEAWTIAHRAAILTEHKAVESSIQPVSVQKEAQSKKCSQYNNNETHCPTFSCEYDKIKKECKAKLGTENTETGAGASGCAWHSTDKTACENDKTGEKQNCAWRKGKHGQYDKDTERCRNDIFF